MNASVDSDERDQAAPGLPVAHDAPAGGGGLRARLLTGAPVVERHVVAAGIGTALLEGGHGPPLVLLHGPGESAVKWLRVLPALTATHRVIAPDLPAHGATETGEGDLGANRMLAWLDELIERTCPARPALLGHVLGGAIAARYAVEESDRLDRLVLVDSLGLGRFRPAPRFALTMIRFLRRPNERRYDRFMRQCSYDLDNLREGMGPAWEPFVAYNLELAGAPSARAAGSMMREIGVRRIPDAELARITAPTDLIWGRHDRANRLRIAEAASRRFGWPLHVIESCADDPARDRPEAFVAALRRSLDAPVAPIRRPSG